MIHDPNDTPAIDPAQEPEAAALAAAEAEDQTAREAAAAQQEADDAAAAAQAKAEADAAAAAAPVDPVVAAVAENTAATRALAEQIAADRAAAASASKSTPDADDVTPRDFDAELAALEQKYDDGDIDHAEYRKAERALIREQTQAETLAAVAKQNEAAAEAARKAHEAAQEVAWNEANATFFADPGNAALIGDNVKRAAFQAAVQDAFTDAKGTLSFDQVLVKARERITGVAAVDPKKAIAEANFARRDTSAPAQTLRDVPNASSNNDSPGATLDSMSVADLEDALMQMDAAATAKYLASAPGGLNDNPRQH